MADWTDGPEYAPQARPDAFVAPVVSALPDGPAVARPVAPEPGPAPQFTGSETDVPLGRLSGPAEPARDPRESFSVVSTPLATLPDVPSLPAPTQPLTLTGQPAAEAGTPPWPPAGQPAMPVPQGSVWGAVHSAASGPRPHDAWAPQQPMALPDQPPVRLPPAPSQPPTHVNPQGFPTAQDPSWYAAYGRHVQPPTPGPVTVRAMLDAADPIVLACLAGGGILPFAGLTWAAPALLLLAAALGTQRIRYRRRAVRNAFVACASVATALAVLAATESYSPRLWAFWDALCGWTQFACWVLLPTLLLLVHGALRRGEPPAP